MSIVVARYPNAGFGDHLSGLMGAWSVAKHSNRTLVIDWRGSRYNADKHRNCFHDFFDRKETLGGVPVIADDRVAEFDFDFPVWPKKWNKDNLRATDHVPHTPEECEAINTLASERRDRKEPTIVINQDIAAELPMHDFREFTKDLVFAEKVRQMADQFASENLPGERYIGIHIRHGNGENIGGRAVYWLDPPSLIRQLRANKRQSFYVSQHSDRDGGAYADNMPPSLTARTQQAFEERRLYNTVARRVAEVRASAGAQMPVFLCTDAQRVIDGLKARIDGVVTFDKTMLDASGGPLHQTKITSGSASSGFVADNVIADMLVETELLRRSCSLICIPSQFSIIPRIELDDADIHLLKPSFVNRVVGKLFA